MLITWLDVTLDCTTLCHASLWCISEGTLVWPVVSAARGYIHWADVTLGCTTLCHTSLCCISEGTNCYCLWYLLQGVIYIEQMSRLTAPHCVIPVKPSNICKGLYTSLHYLRIRLGPVKSLLNFAVHLQLLK